MNAEHQKAAQLRAILGPEPTEAALYSLLERHGGDVNAAADAFFGGSGAPLPQAQAQPLNNIVRVRVPDGLNAGSPLRVQTAHGLMQVNVPAGLSAGDDFLVRVPPTGPMPSAQAYPGTDTQPQHVVIHHVSPPVIVHSHPYAYPYPYYDPFFPGAAVGLLGGLVIADAFFW